MFCTPKFYSFDPNNPRFKYGYLTPNSRYSVEQVPPPIVVGLDQTWDKKVAMDMFLFPRQVLFLKNDFVPLNSYSASVEYNRRFQSFL